MPLAIKIGNIIAAFLVAATPAWAQEVKVMATVDRNEMHQGDTFTYSITASSNSSVNVEQPQLPNMTDFELVNAWGGSSARSTFSNGTFQVEQSRVFNYMFTPKKAGNLTVGEAAVKVNGQVYKTQAITLKVLPGQAPAPQVAQGGGQGQGQGQEEEPQDPFEEMDNLFEQLLKRRQNPGTRTQPENLSDTFFIQLEVDKAKAYAGEQVTASWYLYTRGQIRDIDTLKYPSLSGFWKEEIFLATRLDFQTEVINGVPWQKAMLASYALFPIKKGSAEIDPYQAKCTVVSMNGFGFGQAAQFTKASKPVKIEVLDIPTEGRPNNFTGAVGQFKVSANLDQTTAPANQPVTLKLRFEGRGNAKLIELPPLNLPPSVEIYDSKAEAKFARDGTSYKQFEVLLIPRQPGLVTIPAIGVSAFDPGTRKFYTQMSGELTLTVTPSSGDKGIAAQPLAARPKSSVPQELELPGLALEWQESAQSLLLPKTAVWSLLYALIFAFLGWRGVVELGAGHKKKSVVEVFRKRMKEIQDLSGSGQWREVGAEVTNLVYFVLGDLAGEGGSHDSIDKMLQMTPPSVRREVGQDLIKSMSYFEALGFAPEAVVGALKEKPEMKKRVQEIEKILYKAIQLSGRLEDQEVKGDSI